MSLYDKIRLLTAIFVDGELSVAQFRELFKDLVAETDRTQIAANSLILDIDGEFAELYAGLITQEEFLTRIRAIAPLANQTASYAQSTSFQTQRTGTASNFLAYAVA